MLRAIRGSLGKSRGSQERFGRIYVTGTRAAINRRCDSNRTRLVLQRRGCENLHLFDLRWSREQFIGPRPQRLRNLTAQVSVAAPFVCKGIEDAELPRPKLDRIPFQRSTLIDREGLSRLQKCFGIDLFAWAC